MKLTASAIVRNEAGRYLQPWLDHLLEFCDQVVIVDDGSTDDTVPVLHAAARAAADTGAAATFRIVETGETTFFQHEGAARQGLLDFTLETDPTHVLAIDADEFVSDGRRLRRIVESNPEQPLWSLTMQEIWETDVDCLCVREDGGWRSHEVPIVWRNTGGALTIHDRALACGRIPVQHGRGSGASGLQVLHFGWANETERAARHHRYAVADGGRFHARRHLDSIMYGCDRIDLHGRDWPPALAPYRDAITARAAAAVPT